MSLYVSSSTRFHQNEGTLSQCPGRSRQLAEEACTPICPPTSAHGLDRGLPSPADVRQRLSSCSGGFGEWHRSTRPAGADLLTMVTQFVLATLYAIYALVTRRTPSIYRTRRGQTIVTELSALKSFLYGAGPFSGSVNDAPIHQSLITRAMDLICEVAAPDLLAASPVEVLRLAMCSGGRKGTGCEAAFLVQQRQWYFWRGWPVLAVPSGPRRATCLPYGQAASGLDGSLVRTGRRGFGLDRFTRAELRAVFPITSGGSSRKTNAAGERGPPVFVSSTCSGLWASRTEGGHPDGNPGPEYRAA
jgi:hypothetical protein